MRARLIQSIETLEELTMLRGRYGDTHISPAALLDVADPVAVPPSDAHEVQFRLPLSLSALLDGRASAGLDDDVAAWRKAYTHLVQEQVLRRVQEACGYAADPASPDVGLPARLELAAVMALCEMGSGALCVMGAGSLNVSRRGPGCGAGRNWRGRTSGASAS